MKNAHVQRFLLLCRWNGAHTFVYDKKHDLIMQQEKKQNTTSLFLRRDAAGDREIKSSLSFQFESFT